MNISSEPGVAVALFPLLTTTGTGTPVVVAISSQNARVHIIGVGTISTGTLLIEESNDPTYAGLWSLVYTVDLTEITGGASQTIHIASTLGVIRLRLSVDVTGAGGSISADLVTE